MAAESIHIKARENKGASAMTIISQPDRDQLKRPAVKLRRTEKTTNMVGWTVSAGLHVLAIVGLLALETPNHKNDSTTIEVAIKKKKPVEPKVVEPAPPPEPKPQPKPKKRPKPKVRIAKKSAPPPPSNTTKPKEPKPNRVKPIFGVSMNSVTTGTSGPAMAVRVGNTLAMKPTKEFVKPEDVQPYQGAELPKKPTPSYKLSSMPIPRRLVKAKYPEKARRDGIEGEIILRLTIDENGKVVRVRIVRGLGHGLDELAKVAAMDFRFDPATANGRPVATVIPFTYRWEIID